MKKSLVALAVLAATAGAAMAQSNVTLYGRIDTSFGADKLNGVNTTRLYSGNLTTSRLGFRGTEDLGGGLKAIFGLEGTVGADTGAFSSFDRQSIVGLSGGFGTVKLGRHDTSFDDIRDISVSSNLWDSEFSPTKIAYTAGVADYSSRASNQVRYESPSFGGFSVGVSHGLDEDATVKADTTSYNLRYRSGPLDVGIGFQDQKANNREYTALSGAYDFGVARLSAGYNRAEVNGGAKANGYALGVNVPLGNVEVSVGYAYSKAKTAAGATAAKGSGLAAGVTYALSKRTRLYGALLDGDVENGAGVTTTDRRLYSVGVRHDF
jgi:predicted porin